MLFQPTNVIPSLFANPENATVTKSDPIYIAWQVNGNSPLTKAVVRVLTNDPSHTQVGNPLTITPSEPFYPTDSRGNPQIFEYESATATWGNTSQFGLQNGNDYLLTIEQFWSETESITMYAPVAFRCRDLPVFLPNESGETIVMTEDKGLSKTFKPFNYSHTDDAPIAYVRWVLYDSDGNVIDDTGEVYTQIMEYSYDCFEEGKEYTLDVRVTNIFGQTPSARRKIGKWNPQELYWHYTNFTPVVRCRPDDTIAIEFPTITNPNVQFAVVRCDEDGSNSVNLGLYPNTTIIVKDFGIQSGKSYVYRVYLYDSAVAPFPTAFPVEPPVSKQFSAFSLVECAETSDGEYAYVNLYRFTANISESDISNNNAPTFLSNFTRYPLRQGSRTAPKSGALQALICNPIMGEYSDNAERMEQLFALSQSENVFFLKDPKGNIYKVHTSAPITQAVSNGATQQVTVNIPWQEIGSAKGAAITDAGTSEVATSALEAAERASTAASALVIPTIEARENTAEANDILNGLPNRAEILRGRIEETDKATAIYREVESEEVVIFNALTFSSPQTFTISAPKQWDGIIEYSIDKDTWTEWDGTTISAASVEGNYDLYIRGTGNTVIKGNNNTPWTITGSEVSCIGNIESLLDYATVADGGHPTMSAYCFYYMFYQCAALVKAPELPATKLVARCYMSMFYNCTSLLKAPELPATTLALQCYHSMFYNCTNLAQAPELPATTLASQCYYSMFYNCRSLTKAPELPATTLAERCCYLMFQGCTSLTKAPALPATTLADNCYNSMFQGCLNLNQAPELPATTLTLQCYTNMFDGCTALTEAPALPATTLANQCYYLMFYGCISLTEAPELPATELVDNCYRSMFYNCTNLAQAPALPATTLAPNCYAMMFRGCTNLVNAPALPATTLAEECYFRMFYECTKIKLSETQSAEYPNAYRIPTSGTGTTATDSLTEMFVGTGGTFTGTPTPNTTYYTANEIV